MPSNECNFTRASSFLNEPLGGVLLESKWNSDISGLFYLSHRSETSESLFVRVKESSGETHSPRGGQF